MAVKSISGLILTFVLGFSGYALSLDSDYEKAVQAYYEGKVNESFIHLKNALEQDPRNLPAKVLLAKVYVENGALELAITEFDEALEYNVDINLILKEYTTALILTKKYKKILNIEESNVRTPASKYELLLAKGTAYLNLELVELGRASLTKAHEIYPDDTRALNTLASFEIENNNPEAALTLINKSISIAPNDHRTVHLKGKYWAATGNIEKEIESYQTALTIFNEDPIVQRSLVGAYIKNNQIEDAKVLLDEVLEKTPDDPRMKLLLSWVLSIENKNTESTKVLEEIANSISLYDEDTLTDDPALIFINAIAYFTQGNLENARKELLKYLAIVPSDLRAIFTLAQVYRRQNNASEAMYLLERSFSVVSKDKDVGLYLAELYENSGKKYELERLLEALHRSFPNDTDIGLRLVSLYSKSGRLKQADDILNQVNEQQGAESFKLAQGIILLENNEVEKAEAIGQELIADTPENPQVLNFIGALNIKKRQPDIAKTHLEKALEIEPNFFEARFNYATALKMLGEYDQSLEILETLFELAPSNTSVKFMLAQVYLNLNQVNDAIEIFESINIGEAAQLSREILFDIYFERKDFEQALKVVNKLNDESLYNVEYILDKVSVLAELSMNEEAKKQLGILFGLAETDARLLYEVAKWQRIVSDFEGADKSHQKLKTLVPDNLIVKVEAIRLLITKEQLDEAERRAKSLLVTTKNNPNVLGLLGDVYFAQQRPQSAFEQYWKAIEIDSSFDLMAFKLYQLAADGVNPEKVSQLLTRLKDANPSQSWRSRLLADHFFNIQKWQLAEPLYRELIASSEFAEHPFILNNLALIELSSDPEAALIKAQKAYELAPDNANVIDTFAWANAKAGAYRKSLELLRTAYTLDSSNLEIQFHLAYVLNKIDRNGEALRLLESILAQPDNAQAFGLVELKASASSLLAEIKQKPE